ncbi:MAG: FAD-binding oxidoreductase [Desulfobacterales bacterium]|nr:FAD-binding oxidoreductase [Desulfobacterales bacterium]
MSHHSDVLIIGGGIIGVSCAYYLLEKGFSVRIIEKETMGSGAISGNCGLIVKSEVTPLCEPGVVLSTIKNFLKGNTFFSIKPGFKMNLFPWLKNFAMKCNEKNLENAMKAKAAILDLSRRLFDELIEKEQMDCDFESSGLWLIFKTEKGMNEQAEADEILKRFDLSGIPYSGQALLKKEPALRDDLSGGWFYPVDAHVRPDKLMSSWSKVVKGMGGFIEEYCPARKINLKGDKIQKVKTAKGDFTADHYILATGAWSPFFGCQLGLNLPIQPAKGYSITTERPGLCLNAPCIFGEHHVVGTPWDSGYRLGGTLTFSGYNEKIDPAHIKRMKAAEKVYLRETVNNNHGEEWVGLRPMTYDDLPIIDWSPKQKNLIIAAGHNMMGLSMATGTGVHVAELLEGIRTYMDPKLFSLQRF